MSLIKLGQGVPFFLGGDDLLCSKDMDQNSYDSGDWFNKIDWSGNGDNWGIGLPIASQNQPQWPDMLPLLSDGAYTPQPSDIGFAAQVFQDFLQIRDSSGLFRMPTLEQIQQNLSFLNAGTSQTPGLIIMKLDEIGSFEPYKHIVVVFNATGKQTTFTDTRLVGLSLHLDPIQQQSADVATRSSAFTKKTGPATVAALATAVFLSE